MKNVHEVTLSYTFLSVHSSRSLSTADTSTHSRARRDSYGNLVPSEGPLAVEGSTPALL